VFDQLKLFQNDLKILIKNYSLKYVSLLFNNVTRTGYELIYKYKYNFPANLVVDTQARLIVEVTRRSLHFQSGNRQVTGAITRCLPLLLHSPIECSLFMSLYYTYGWSGISKLQLSSIIQGILCRHFTRYFDLEVF
jgi:hypothetical protein